MARQFVRFVAVGVANTALFLVVYLAFRLLVAAAVASVLASLLTTVTGTNANGRIAFGVTGPVRARQHVKSLAVTVLGMVLTSFAVDTFGGGSQLRELAVLVLASAAAGGLRFLLMRHWVFGSLLVLTPSPEEVETGNPENRLPNLLGDGQQLVQVRSNPVEGGEDRQHVLV
jgi:putative flippase GtrA